MTMANTLESSSTTISSTGNNSTSTAHISDTASSHSSPSSRTSSLSSVSTAPPITEGGAAGRTNVNVQDQDQDDEEDNDPRHIFTVAARSLQECADLLESIKAATAVEQEPEREQAQEEGQGQGQVHTDKHTSNAQGDSNQSLIITPCKRSEMYTKPSMLACKGTIGKHVRHLHDHFRLLLSTYPSYKGTSFKDEWAVDYDKRDREVPMETDIDYAIQELRKSQHTFEQCRSHPEEVSMSTDLLQPVTLQATIDPARSPIGFQTTFGRELWFCSLHAVHHFAMIKVICSEFGMPLTDGFGVAPSTIKSRQ
ncbi:hypothetical protein EDD11_007864 [Mortierella claussenii]|nr:hypothetical protein EDD11_007864 [Mortierella claussenii]